jgi:predicted Rossmann fold flavoprotein
MMDAEVIVIGAGAAGMLAAGTAAAYGARVVVLEKMEAPGKKILITGKGRCNITNFCDREELLQNIPTNPKFLYGAVQAFSIQECIDFFNRLGVLTKVERGNRVFPQSDQAGDVVNALLRYLRENGVVIRLNAAVQGLQVIPGGLTVKLATGELLKAAKVIIATGGLSAPGTGSTGDGYRWAEQLGHLIQPLLPSIVPLETKENWVKEAQGLTLKNIEATVTVQGKVMAKEFGELLFTHWGVSGPVVLTLSNWAVPALAQGKPVQLLIDLKPALTTEQLDQRIQRDFTQNIRKQYKNSLSELLPKSLISPIIQLSGIPEDKFIHQITREERSKLVNLLKGLSITISKARPVREAVITAGGVSIKEVNPKTMESKLVPGLYFAGEILDVHGFTGGFNLQIAWSTGFVAGKAAAGGA